MGTTKWVGGQPVGTKRGSPSQKWPVRQHRPRFAGHEAMTDNDSAADKSIVNELNFGAKTSKRVGWEAWDFTVVGPHQVEVTNASWGFQKEDHSYVVGIDERDGVPIPAECECKADLYNEEYSCKHRVACATVGGPVVLQAAVDYSTPRGDASKTDMETLEDKLRADGGITEDAVENTQTLNAANQNECDCGKLADNFPCWACVRDGKRELP